MRRHAITCQLPWRQWKSNESIHSHSIFIFQILMLTVLTLSHFQLLNFLISAICSLPSVISQLSSCLPFSVSPAPLFLSSHVLNFCPFNFIQDSKLDVLNFRLPSLLYPLCPFLFSLSLGPAPCAVHLAFIISLDQSVTKS